MGPATQTLAPGPGQLHLPRFLGARRAVRPAHAGAWSRSKSSPQAAYDDHQNMMDQLGVKAIRRGPDPNNRSTFDEATANPYKDSMPDVLRMKDGTKVTRAKQWPKRRAEILEDFEREVYGRIPKSVPSVTWEVTSTTPGDANGVPTVKKTLVGHVDNSAYPQISVNIQANFTVPANAKKAMPMMIEFGFGSAGPDSFPHGKRWQSPEAGAIGEIIPSSIQPDNNRLRTGIIGLTNKGQPRKPDDWGALRAWQWGVSRLIDYFEANRDSMVDPKRWDRGAFALWQGGHRDGSVRPAGRGRIDRLVG